MDVPMAEKTRSSVRCAIGLGTIRDFAQIVKQTTDPTVGSSRLLHSLLTVTASEARQSPFGEFHAVSSLPGKSHTDFATDVLSFVKSLNLNNTE
jgi:hypothetical protein